MVNKTVICIACGKEYRAPLIREAIPGEDDLVSEQPQDESLANVACPFCGTQNTVTTDLPDWVEEEE